MSGSDVRRSLSALGVAGILLAMPSFLSLPASAESSAQTPAASLSPLGNTPAIQQPTTPSAPLSTAPAQIAPESATQPAKIAPAQPPTPEEYGDTLALHRRYQAAIDSYSKAPQTASVWNKMGIAYQMMFNLREATRCYKESLKLDPRNPSVLNNLGTIYDSQKEYKAAEHYYRKALKLSPHSALILKNLGTNLLTQRKYNRGWDEYKQALAIDPQIFQDRNSPQVQNPTSVQQRGAMNYYMAMGCVRAGLTDCALQYLRMALDEGFISPKKIAADVAFASLRDNPDFKQLLASQNNSKAAQAR